MVKGGRRSDAAQRKARIGGKSYTSSKRFLHIHLPVFEIRTNNYSPWIQLNPNFLSLPPSSFLSLPISSRAPPPTAPCHHAGLRTARPRHVLHAPPQAAGCATQPCRPRAPLWATCPRRPRGPPRPRAPPAPRAAASRRHRRRRGKKKYLFNILKIGSTFLRC